MLVTFAEGKTNLLVTWEPLGQESSSNSEGTGSGNGLDGHVAPVGDDVVAWNPNKNIFQWSFEWSWIWYFSLEYWSLLQA